MRRFVLLLYALLVLTMAVEGVVPPLLPIFKEELELSTLQTSLFLAMPYGLMFALSIPIGAAVDRYGARIVTLLGGGLLGAGAVLQALAPNYEVLLAGRAVFGIALGTAWTAGVAWLAGQPTGGSRVVGGTTAAAALGFVLGPALGGALADRFGTAVPLLVYAATALVVTVALGAVRGIQLGRVERREPVLRTLRLALREPLVVGAVALVLLSGLANGSSNLLVPLGLDEQGFSPAEIGAVFAGTAALFLVVSVAVARRGDALVNVGVAGFGLLATACVLLLPALSGAAWALVGFLFLRVPFAWAVLATITFPLALAGAQAAALRVGAIVGVVNVGWSLSSTLGPLGGGALAEATGPRGTFAVLCCAFAVVGGLLVAADRRRRAARLRTGA